MESYSRLYVILQTVTSGFTPQRHPLRPNYLDSPHQSMTKPNLSDIERKAAIDELLWISINGTLPRGTYAKVATGMGCDPTTISAIWNRYAATGDTGVRGGE
ncbi:hypothetical protein L917_05629 [Phytophthora nicotianae]|uniref:DUF7769 domain-containing protein n=1 Tax=Phytophthora nicotianae TaxID=4792 RepID=W2NR60_PHYNI|nr:hypothetical protein L917_05629 [Phytophthora nicotianae]ETM50164.1 hypothetical protein L914_05755 [Phytophthora nicotianae]